MKRFILLATALLSSGFAQEERILPSPFPVTRYSSVWENSPFNREVVAQIIVQNQSAFATNLVLEGLVTDQNEGSIAYLRDLKENTFLVVTAEKSGDSPIFLVNATKSKNPSETVVTISDGEETADIKYADGIYTQKIDSPPPAAATPQNTGNKTNDKPATSNSPAGANDAAPPGTTSPGNPANDSTPAASGPPTEGGPPAQPSGRRRILLPSTRG